MLEMLGIYKEVHISKAQSAFISLSDPSEISYILSDPGESLYTVLPKWDTILQYFAWLLV